MGLELNNTNDLTDNTNNLSIGPTNTPANSVPDNNVLANPELQPCTTWNVIHPPMKVTVDEDPAYYVKLSLGMQVCETCMVLMTDAFCCASGSPATDNGVFTFSGPNTAEVYYLARDKRTEPSICPGGTKPKKITGVIALAQMTSNWGAKPLCGQILEEYYDCKPANVSGMLKVRKVSKCETSSNTSTGKECSDTVLTFTPSIAGVPPSAITGVMLGKKGSTSCTASGLEQVVTCTGSISFDVSGTLGVATESNGCTDVNTVTFSSKTFAVARGDTCQLDETTLGDITISTTTYGTFVLKYGIYSDAGDEPNALYYSASIDKGKNSGCTVVKVVSAGYTPPSVSHPSSATVQVFSVGSDGKIYGTSSLIFDPATGHAGDILDLAVPSFPGIECVEITQTFEICNPQCTPPDAPPQLTKVQLIKKKCDTAFKLKVLVAGSGGATDTGYRCAVPAGPLAGCGILDPSSTGHCPGAVSFCLPCTGAQPLCNEVAGSSFPVNGQTLEVCNVPINDISFISLGCGSKFKFSNLGLANVYFQTSTLASAIQSHSTFAAGMKLEFVGPQ